MEKQKSSRCFHMMKPASRRRCTANMRTENEEKRWIFASMTRIGLVAAQCAGKLTAPYTYDGTMNDIFVQALVWKDIVEKTAQKPSHHHKQCFFSQERGLISNRKKKKSPHTLIFCCRVHRNTILLRQVGCLTRNITGQIHRYSPVAAAFDTILQGK